MRKTKIVCTLGPSTDDRDTLIKLVKAGMNVARLNFSHGTHEEHKVRVEMVKEVRKELGVPLAIMIDTKGPDVRVGRFEGNYVELRSGDTFTLTTQACIGTAKMASVTYENFCCKLSPGAVVMLDDGMIKLVVEECDAMEAVCRVMNSGIISNNKSVNTPGIKLDIPYMREKDIEDIKFAIDNDFDYIAASFVRNADDVWQIKKILKENGADFIKIISKIENSEGIDNIEDILEISDSIMIARGDMGVELPLEDLPAIQKTLIKKSLSAGKKAITATQMLESMIKSPRPTRAEVNDVANAIYDGTSAIMLSGETSVGQFPVETVETMARIAEVTESQIDYEKRFNSIDWAGHKSHITDAISHAVCSIANTLDTKSIFALTEGGETACMVSRYRPSCGLVAFTPHEKVYHQLSLSWGCSPLVLEEMDNLDMLLDAAMRLAERKGYVSNGDRIVFTCGVPLGRTGYTNMVRVGTIGKPQV